ncbi:MAG: class I SAM-dependent methyltransferase [Elusimicrobiaceae bacterium]
MSGLKVKSGWQREFFDKRFYEPSSPLAVKCAGAEAAFFVKALGLKKGAKLLDLACGQGRHCVEFAKKGLAVTGFDFTKEYLADARERAEQAGVSVAFVCGDMRKLAYRNEFDAVVCAFTSFGYFDRKTNFVVLKKIAAALKPGGKVIIDVISRDFVESDFLERDWYKLEDGGYQLEERDYDARSRVIKCHWIRLSPDGKSVAQSFRHEVFSADDLKVLYKRAGLVPLKCWSALSFGKGDGRRTVVLGRKPAAA